MLAPLVREPSRGDAGVFLAVLPRDYCLVWEAGVAGALVDYRLRNAARPALNAHAAGHPLLFDLDGTLTDNFEGISRSILHALAALGAVPPPASADCEAASGRRCAPRSRSCSRTERSRSQSSARSRTTASATARSAGARTCVCDGVAPVVAALRAAGAQLVTSAHPSRSRTPSASSRISASRRTSPASTALTSPARSTTRRSSWRICSRAKASTPDACAMIGDREHDVRAAHANGVRAVGVLWGYGSARLNSCGAGADALAESPADAARDALSFARAG